MKKLLVLAMIVALFSTTMVSCAADTATRHKTHSVEIPG